jgi:2-oxoglutarate/2-oxoacid ferredoxin oxidoreductase subunit beta
MEIKDFEIGNADTAWCPGCGNFSILNILKKTFSQMNIGPENLAMVSGIGQAAKTPHYIKCNFFNGLHGRALPAATALKLSNPALTVIAESGDGCMYGEGGNHFIHAIRRNPNITFIAHNNMVYGLTKGQASPTSRAGFKTPVQVNGVSDEPFNPLAVAISLNASFVARAYCADMDAAVDILKQAMEHKGFSIVDIFQPCVTFNKINTYQWFKEHTYYLEKEYKPDNRIEAFRRALETDKFPLGIFYKNDTMKTLEENLLEGKIESPAFRHEVDLQKITKFIESKRN